MQLLEIHCPKRYQTVQQNNSSGQQRNETFKIDNMNEDKAIIASKIIVHHVV
jgi:hypothetical protein